MAQRMVIAAVLGACCEALADPGFWLVGTPNYAISSPVTALSRDGGRACGYLYIYYPFYGEQGFSWTPGGGRDDWGSKDSWFTVPGGMNADGSVLAGSMYEKIPELGRPFRRVGNSEPEDLGLLPGTTMGWANDVTDDGNTVVGRCDIEYGMTGEAFRWTADGGMHGLGFLKPGDDHSGAMDITPDGRTIVGFSRKDASNARPFSWTEEGGMVGLPLLPAAKYCIATAVSADGSVIVGWSKPNNIDSRAARWVNSEVEDLGVPLGYTSNEASSMSDAGDVVGGWCYGGGTGDAAMVWIEGMGSMLLADYIAMCGLQVPADYTLKQVNAVSGDGLTFGGWAYNSMAKVTEGFVVTVPSPSAGALLLAPWAWRRRRGA